MSALPGLTAASVEARRPRWLLGAAGIALAAGLGVLLLRGVDLERVLAAFRGADARPLALAVLLNLTLNNVARIQRRWTLVRPLAHAGAGVGLGELAAVFLVGFAANHLLPARAGDALSTVQLHRRHGYAVEGLLAAGLVETITGLFSMCLLALPVALFAPPEGLPDAPVHMFLAIGLPITAALAWALWRGSRGLAQPSASANEERTAASRLSGAFGRFVGATRLLGSFRIWTSALLWSWVSDLADVGMIALCLAAVGIPAGLGTWVLVYVSVNLAIAAPLTPGQVGALEAGAVVALVALGVDRAEAVAFALLYHATHVLPIVFAGLLGLGRLRWEKVHS